ncbi:hypothetical protein ACFPM0_21775 [Pseudonocardia sulfidoxydans]
MIAELRVRAREQGMTDGLTICRLDAPATRIWRRLANCGCGSSCRVAVV